jgi:peptidyl-prolyl cis-trans isomerase A (cyclophilin A)
MASYISVGLMCVLLLVSSVSAKEWRVRFHVANLDGEPGEDHKGSFVLAIHDDWSPLGAARFKELIDTQFFSGVRFFRVVEGFVAQFGIHGKPAVASEWRTKTIADDPVKESNKRGSIVFATSGKNSRTTQLFINFKDNANLDSMGFSPFGNVLGDGMKIVDRIFKVGEAPDQGQIQSRGNQYLKREFPRLTYIEKTELLSDADEL